MGSAIKAFKIIKNVLCFLYIIAKTIYNKKRINKIKTRTRAK